MTTTTATDNNNHEIIVDSSTNNVEINNRLNLTTSQKKNIDVSDDITGTGRTVMATTERTRSDFADISVANGDNGGDDKEITKMVETEDGTLIKLLKNIRKKWVYYTEEKLHKYIIAFILSLSLRAIRYPVRCIVLIIILSFALFIIGLSTNFKLEVEDFIVFSPFNSRPSKHYSWILEESNFPAYKRPFFVMIHANGEDVLDSGNDGIHDVFQALDTIRNTPGYNDICSQSNYLDRVSVYNNDNNNKQEQPQQTPECPILSITRFWNHNITAMMIDEKEEEQKQRTEIEKADKESPSIIGNVLSSSITKTFPGGAQIDYETFLGKPQIVNGTVVSAKAYFIVFILPDINEDTIAKITENDFETDNTNITLTTTRDFEGLALKNILQLQKEWDEDVNQSFQLEVISSRSYPDEFQRAIEKDLYLIPVVFLTMAIFTMIIFYFQEKQQPNGSSSSCIRRKTRVMVGLGSVVTIVMSLMTGYGLMFIIGIPFTNMTILLPFIVFGVGLDDTFIIVGEYFRQINNENGNQISTIHNEVDDNSNICNNANADSNDKNTMIEKNIQSTIRMVAPSITLTTTVTCAAFILGCCFSTIPAVYYLCLYSFPTIFIDFIYQITFFISILALDERRIQANRYDCCCCCFSNATNKTPPPPAIQQEQGIMDSNADDDDEKDIGNQQQEPQEEDENRKPDSSNLIDNFMVSYCKYLLLPYVKIGVMIVAILYFGFSIRNTLLWRQKFTLGEVVPKDSYVLRYYYSFIEYSDRKTTMTVYFRNLDFSDEQIQQQMVNYIDDLMELPQLKGSADVDNNYVIDKGEHGNEHQLPQLSFCWIKDFTDDTNPLLKQYVNMTFDEKVVSLLNINTIKEIYGDNIVLSDQGSNSNASSSVITASRCVLQVLEIDMDNVQDQMQLLKDQRRITEKHNKELVSLRSSNNKNDSNNHKKAEADWSFFAFEKIFLTWEFYSACVRELITTTITSIIAVTIIGFIFIPHWTSAFFLLPLIIVLYIDLIGTIKLAGLNMNVVTYVSLVISIGLMVDFVMHVLLRYYESTAVTRNEKVKEALCTMGSSVLLGAISTFLGVVPLAFSTGQVINNIFVCFLAMVIIASVHGLIVLPVLLTWFGPININHDINSTNANRYHDEKNVAKETDISVLVDDDNNNIQEYA